MGNTQGVAAPRKTLISALVAYLARLRFPVLLAITAALFLVDLMVPDVLPLVDEALLGLVTVLLASWRKRRVEPAGEAPGQQRS